MLKLGSSILLIVSCSLSSVDAGSLVYEGDAGPGQGKHIVLIAGDHEYRSEETLPALGRLLAKHHGFKCTVLFNIDPKSGEIVAGKPSNIPGMEVLDTADLAVVFLRFQNLPVEQMKHFDAYLKRGGPVVGLRTSTHAFKIPDSDQYAKYSYRSQSKEYELGFGHQVLGQTWVGHYGRNHKQSTRISVIEDRQRHPILRGVKDVWVHAGGYVGKPTDGVVLTMAQPLDGMTPDSPPSKTQPPMPSEWTRTYVSDSGNEGRVFTSLYGTPEDLSNEGYRRLIVNGTFWAIGLEKAIMPDMNVDVVGAFSPSTFGNQSHVRGIKPEMYRGFESPIPAMPKSLDASSKKKQSRKLKSSNKDTTANATIKRETAASVDAAAPVMIKPNWDSMAAHYQPPKWFQDGKVGVWTHWGVPSSIDETRPNDGSHYGRRMYGPNDGETGKQLEMTQTLSDWHVERYGDPSEFGYEDFVPEFRAENWNAGALVKFFKDNGARFVMPVATHHDNFDMYDSFHPWNAVDMGPKRDTIAEWKQACRKHGLKFGVSTHLYWSPRFFKQARKHQTEGTLESKLFNLEFDPENYAKEDSWNEHWYARCWELIEKYDPDMFNNDSPFPDEKRGKGLGVKLFSDFLNRDISENRGQQTAVLSFKASTMNRKAFTYNCERGMSGELQPEPWMWATDVSGGWFYRKGSITRMSIPVLIANAVDAISKNGIVMMNVALRGDGTLPEEQAAYLSAFGEWMKINADAIYGSRPWKVFGEGPTEIKTARTGENTKPYQSEDIRFTTKEGKLYAFVLATPKESVCIQSLAAGGMLEKKIESISLLGSESDLRWERNDESLKITLPEKVPNQPVVAFEITMQELPR